ncbi:hypothetical protein ACFL20_03375 [Spirochaetota bacterium]
MYNIQTTLNINKNVLYKLNQASDVSGRSRTELIVMLLKKVMKNDCVKSCIERSIKYQQCNEKKSWHTFHITFRGDEYEYFVDLRKLLKMSLSYILAFAVKKYLNSIISGESTDNYMFENYIIAKEDADGIIYWKLFWGVPDKIAKYINFHDI